MTDQERHAQWLVEQAAGGRLSRREFTGRAGALGIALSASAGLWTAANAATPRRGGHLRIGTPHGSTSDTLNPATIENAKQWLGAYTVASTLTEVAPDGTLKAGLATAWDASPDAKTWTFTLRDGVEFHNGKTLTPEDVIASLNFHRGEETKSVGKPVVAPIVSMKADGKNKVVIELSGASADFPFNFSDATFGIYPAKDDTIDWEAGGAGGYILANDEPGVRYDFERFGNYWREDGAYLDSAEVLTIFDGAARVNALLTGEVDAIDTPDLKTLSRLEKVPSITIEEGSGPLHYTFPMLMEMAPFDDPDVRKAMKYALDREEMVEKILLGHGSVGNDTPIGPSYRYHAADMEQNAYDPDKAAFHMKKAGMAGKTFKLSAADAAFSGAVDAAQLYQASAKKAGIEIEVVREPNDGYWSNVWMAKSWCACYWGGKTTEDAMFSIAYAPGAAWNDTQWDDAKFTALMVEARGELDEAKRAEMYHDMQGMLREDGGAVVPMFANGLFARNDKVAHGDLSWTRSLDGLRALDRWWMTG